MNVDRVLVALIVAAIVMAVVLAFTGPGDAVLGG